MSPKMDQLKLESAALEDIFKGSFDEIMVHNQEGVIEKVNAVCEENYHLPAEEIVGRHVRDLEKEGIFYPSASLEVIKKKQPVEMLQKTKYGRYLHVRGRPIFDRNGNLVRVVCYSRDLTELMNLKKKIEKMEGQLENYKQDLNETIELKGFISKSSSMKKVLNMIQKIARVDTTALILGETGVGKSEIVKLIHNLSHRNKQVLNEINCAVLPEQLIESELFGYKGGSFTGAFREGKQGLIAGSQGGTLFLDEIGELPLRIQGKLLQVIQEKKIRPIGGKTNIDVDVRIIAATNRDLEEMMGKGEFRKDLYYRLNVIPIHIPPLRERDEDILPLTYHFLDQFNQEYHQNVRFSPKTLDAFLNYKWEGNIREMENLIERLVVTSDDVVTLKDLPARLTRGQSVKGKKLREILEEVEGSVILETYRSLQSSYLVAKELGISQSTAARKIRKYSDPE